MSNLLLLALAIGEAQASQLALDPQNRVHFGLSVVPEESGVGFMGGLDSRLTRYVAIDVGMFASPLSLAEGIAPSEGERPDFLVLRHGLHVMPGLRIPHAQPRTWAWELFLRGGGGVAWAADTSPEALPTGSTLYAVDAHIAGIGGVDALARFGRFGVRASGKAYIFQVLDSSPLASWVVARPQFGVEGLVQW